MAFFDILFSSRIVYARASLVACLLAKWLCKQKEGLSEH